MFKLTGRILDWIDESSGLAKTASSSFSMSDHALILEDYDGKIGRKYPISNKEDISKSMGSFEKYASRLMPLHRRTAATFISRACLKYDLPPTEKVAMYSDDNIMERTVSYKKALSDYEPNRMAKAASSIIKQIANIQNEDSLDFGVSTHFVKQASFELSSILKDNEVCEKDDPLVKGLHKIAQDNVPLPAEELYEIAQDVCKMASVNINKTILRDPANWPKEVLEKEASEDTLDEFILNNISKLQGHFNAELLEKIAQEPTKTLALLPEEVSKIVADLLTSNE